MVSFKNCLRKISDENWVGFAFKMFSRQNFLDTPLSKGLYSVKQIGNLGLGSHSPCSPT